MIHERALAMHPAELAAKCELLTGDQLHKAHAQHRADVSAGKPIRGLQITREKGTAFVGVVGMLSSDACLAGWFDGVHQATAADQLDDLRADPSVDRVAVFVDSPGGQVQGMPDLIDAARALAAAKPVSVCAQRALSGGYWLAAALSSQLRDLAVTPMGELGSIGVYLVVMDTSSKAARDGVRPVVITGQAGKRWGIPGLPVADPGCADASPDDRAAYERQRWSVEQQARAFAADVAADRSIGAEQVLGFDGATFDAAPSVERGLADRIEGRRRFIGRVRELAAR